MVRVAVVFLAGPSGAGKTSVARLLGELYGYRVVHVDTGQCMGESDPFVRQACFHSVVGSAGLLALKEGVRPGRVVVVDNSLLSVYGYTVAMARGSARNALRVLASTVLRAWREQERVGGVTATVVLSLGPDELRYRLTAKVKERKGDPLNGDTRIHTRALYAIQSIAEKEGLPVIHTDVVGPEETALQIRETINTILRVAP